MARNCAEETCCICRRVGAFMVYRVECVVRIYKKAKPVRDENIAAEVE